MTEPQQSEGGPLTSTDLEEARKKLDQFKKVPIDGSKSAPTPFTLPSSSAGQASPSAAPAVKVYHVKLELQLKSAAPARQG